MEQKRNHIRKKKIRGIYKILFIVLFLVSCKGQNKGNINKNEQIQELEKILLGKWEKLTIEKKDTIIFQPCDANNKTLILSNDSITIDYGQEEVAYLISEKLLDQKSMTIAYSLSDNIIVKCNVNNKNKVFWTIDGTKDLFTNSTKLYKNVKQPCKECWGEDECNEAEEKAIVYQIEGNYSDKYKLYLKNIIYDENKVESLTIDVKNDRLEQLIMYTPEYWFKVPKEATTEFNLSKDIIKTNNGLEEYSQIIFGDYNFDKKEDFAIINYEGSNAGPQYSYFLQNKEGRFYKDDFLTNEVRFFPVEINNKEKYITIVHPLGCCKITTKKYKKTVKGWEILSENVEDIDVY